MYPRIKAYREALAIVVIARVQTLFMICPLLVIMLTGCGTYTFTVKHGPLPEPTDKREGVLAVKMIDRREDKTKIGEMRGGFGNKVGDIVTKGDLETILADAFKSALQKAGYSVVPSAPVTLEGEIREFLVFGGGFTQGAREKIRVRLRDQGGQVLWEHGLKGEDGAQPGTRTV